MTTSTLHPRCSSIHALPKPVKMGFAVEGTRKDAMRVEGSYVDEYYMAKLLG